MVNDARLLRQEIRALRVAIEELTVTLRINHLTQVPPAPGFPMKGDNFEVVTGARFPIPDVDEHCPECGYTPGSNPNCFACRGMKIAEIPDDEIDTSDIPEQGPEFFERAKRKRLKPTKPATSAPPVAEPDPPAMSGPETEEAPPAPTQRREICPECRRKLGTNINCMTCAPPK